MKLTELLERDEESLRGELNSAGSVERAEAALSREMDRLLVTYNAACESDRQRAAASAMLETARSALSLLDTRGEVTVWERSVEAKKFRLPASGYVTGAAGVGLCAAAFVLLAVQTALLPAAALLAAGAALVFLTGYRAGRANAPAKPEIVAEAATDYDKVLRVMHTTALVMDRGLEEIPPDTEPAGLPPPEKDELELLGELLEAACSGNGAFALERLSLIRHYLHTRGITLVDYSAKTADWFDIMPGMSAQTLRPALMSDGTLLLRGLAADGLATGGLAAGGLAAGGQSAGI